MAPYTGPSPSLQMHRDDSTTIQEHESKLSSDGVQNGCAVANVHSGLFDGHDALHMLALLT